MTTRTNKTKCPREAQSLLPSVIANKTRI